MANTRFMSNTTALREQSVELKGSTALLSMNQPEGFDCPGCASSSSR